MVDAEVARRLEALEAPERLRQTPPPPPIMSERNRQLSEAYQKRQAELRALEQAERDRVRLERERKELAAYQDWLSHEPEREAARAELVEVKAHLSEARRDAAPFNRRIDSLESRVSELKEIAES